MALYMSRALVEAQNKADWNVCAGYASASVVSPIGKITCRLIPHASYGSSRFKHRTNWELNGVRISKRNLEEKLKG